MTIADHIADQLFKAGIRRIFGIPGGPSIPYMEAFRRAGIEFVLVSNEASAGIMAHVSARITGVPGVCHATFGPGATNISTGIGGALLDRSPVIVLTSEMSEIMISRTTQMNMNHQKFFEPVTKATFRIDAGNAAEIIDTALDICRDEYPGPVHIGLPAGIAGNHIIRSGSKHIAPEKRKHKNDVKIIASLLASARKPLLAAGLTLKRLAASDKLLSFIRKHRIPVVITPMAKGIIPEDNPGYAGVLFHALSNNLNDLIAESDLVIGLGYDQVEYNYESWLPNVPLIHFDTRESDLPERDNIFTFTGSPQEWFAFLEDNCPVSYTSREENIKIIRERLASQFRDLSSHFGPVAVMKILRQELPENSVLTVDVGSHLHVLGQFWETGTGGDIIISNGWSGMGFGVPAAMAACFEKPGTPVACITGDGGFLMSAGEIVTARRNRLPVIIVVLSDGELNLIRLKQSWEEVPPYGTQLFDGDLFGSDTFLGVKVIKAWSHESMSRAVRKALKIKEPAIINAIIDPADYEQLIIRQ